MQDQESQVPESRDTRFFKVCGGGNDFVALPDPPKRPNEATIQAWCRRGHSLGADGIFVLRREDAATGRAKEVAAVGMEYVNADGSVGDLCLNGTRCAARLAFHLGWADDEVEVRTGAGPILARSTEEGMIALRIPPLHTQLQPISASVGETAYEGWKLDVGVPHFVLVWPEDLATAPVATLGQALVHHPAFGDAGANIDFVRFPSRELIEIRSFERGVDAETLACGTGVIAAAATGLKLDLLDRDKLRRGIEAHTRGGFAMRVGASLAPAEDSDADDPQVTKWTLVGNTRIIASGTLLPEAEQNSQAPRWG